MFGYKYQTKLTKISSQSEKRRMGKMGCNDVYHFAKSESLKQAQERKRTEKEDEMRQSFQDNPEWRAPYGKQISNSSNKNLQSYFLKK